MSLDFSHITRNQRITFSNVHHRDGADALELASAGGFSPATCVRHLEQLVEEGLLTPTYHEDESPTMRRYYLTDEGHAEQQRMTAEYEASLG